MPVLRPFGNCSCIVLLSAIHGHMHYSTNLTRVGITIVQDNIIDMNCYKIEQFLSEFKK